MYLNLSNLKNFISSGSIFAILYFISAFFLIRPVFSHEHKLLTYEQKQKVAEKMKKIANTLGVKCEHCHLEAPKGLRAGDFRMLTDDGDFAHDTMFPLSKKFQVKCDYCHNGHKSFTTAGKKAEKDFDFIDKMFKKEKKKFNCLSCHIPDMTNEEVRFKKLTETGIQMQKIMDR